MKLRDKKKQNPREGSSPNIAAGVGAQGMLTLGALHRAPREALREFLYQTIGYIKARKLYPPGHNRLKKQFRSLWDSTQKILDDQGAVSLFVQPDAIYVSGEKFGTEDSIIKDFTPELVKRLIRYVIIEKEARKDELEALVKPVLMDPKEIHAAGSLQTLLDETLPEEEPRHVHIVELHYDMEDFVKSEEDLEIVRTLARYEHGPGSEPYVLKRLGEFKINDEERIKLNSLLLKPEIDEKLAGLKDLFGQMPPHVQEQIHATDLMIYLVRNITETEFEIGVQDDIDSTQMVAYILDKIHERLLTALSDTKGLPRREILDQVAQQTMSSPDALLEWLSIEAGNLNVAFSPDQASMIKAIFSKPKEGKRSIKFGKTQLETLEAPDPPPEPPSESLTEALDKKQSSNMAEQYARFKEKYGSAKFHLDMRTVTPAHVDVLLQILFIEEDEKARERILREVGHFFGRYLNQDLPKDKFLLTDRFIKVVDRLSESEMAIVLRSTPVCRQALQEFFRGQKHWQGALDCAIRNYPASFAAALGGLMLDGVSDIPLSEIQPFVPQCQDKLVDWLLNRLRDRESPPSVRRVAAIALACRTPRMVPLVEKLFEEMDPNDRVPLLQVLAQVDNNRSIRLLCSQLTDVDHATREVILRMLGESKNLLAEKALLEVAAQPHWGRERLQERLTALSSLYSCGTEYSRDKLHKILKNFWLPIIPGGRKVRRMAANALEAIGAREKKSKRIRVE